MCAATVLLAAAAIAGTGAPALAAPGSRPARNPFTFSPVHGKLSVSPVIGPAGTHVDVHGTSPCFTPPAAGKWHVSVLLEIRFSSVASKDTVPDAQGQWSVDLTVPSGMAGPAFVQADCQGPSGQGTSYDTASFTVTTAANGYWLLSRTAVPILRCCPARSSAIETNVGDFGDALYIGPGSPLELDAPLVGMAGEPTTGLGYRLAAADGGVFTFGSAKFLGAATKLRLRAPVVGIAATPTGNGYWLAASDGGVFSFGDAKFYGAASTIALRAPVVGIAATPTGHGYWLVARDGGVFAYGDAGFHGSAAPLPLFAPVVGIAATPTGNGYWLASSDGGVFSFGDAGFHGGATTVGLQAPIVGIAASASGQGYWLAASDGGVFAYGDAPFAGSYFGRGGTIVGIAATPDTRTANPG